MLTLVGHTAAVRCVAYSPDGGLLASGGDDGAVRVWDLASRHTVWTSEKEGDPGIDAARFHSRFGTTPGRVVQRHVFRGHQ